MTTVLESLGVLPVLTPPDVVAATSERGPRIKKNPDGKMCLARVVNVQSNKVWLIVITHSFEPTLRYRCRVYLRKQDASLVEIEDKEGFYTLAGAEWGAYSALLHILRDLRADRAMVEEEVESCD